VTLTASGAYRFTGTLANGQIVVDITDTTDTGVVKIILAGASVTCTTGPALLATSATKVVVILADGTTNSLTDGSLYSDTTEDAPHAALYCQSNLTIEGDTLNTGILTVTGKAYDGISSQGGLVLKEAQVTVTALDDGIRGNDYLVVRRGDYTVVCGGDGLTADAKDVTKGYVAVESGTLSVTSGGDAVTASTFVRVSGGTMHLKSGGGATVSLGADASAKGLKAGAGVVVIAGSVDLNASDDGIHAGAAVVLGGTLAPVLSVVSGGDGIQAEGSLSGTSGSYTVVSRGDALVAGTSVELSGGSFGLTSGGGSAVTTLPTVSAKGIKAGTSFTLSGGTYAVSSADDCLHAEADGTITGGTFTLAGASVTVSGGNSGGQGVKVGDTGTLTINDGSLTVTKCFEGLAGGHLVINGGTVRITASDDGLSVSVGTDLMTGNDGSTLKITGGYLVVNSGGDGIDVNGSAAVTGGTLLVNGPLPGQPDAPVDYNGTFVMTGGTLVAVGSSQMLQNLSTTSTQGSVVFKLSSMSAGTLFCLKSSTGTALATFAPAKAYQAVLVCSPALAKKTLYGLYTGGTSTGTLTDGLYTGGVYTASSSTYVSATSQ